MGLQCPKSDKTKNFLYTAPDELPSAAFVNLAGSSTFSEQDLCTLGLSLNLRFTSQCLIRFYRGNGLAL